ncbi:phosphopantothenoylcysteine decarboxylase [Candidatus Omnitrophota bacterium]
MSRKRLRIIITAGATREPLDPVRFISNYATGTFGCQLASEAQARGHQVILIHAQLESLKPKGLPAIAVRTAAELQSALAAKFSWCDCLIMSAAVGDFRVRRVARKKIKRGRSKELTLRLEQNPDILAGLGRKKGKRVLVGFALETENLKNNARHKLNQKNLDLIVATSMKSRSYPFGSSRMDGLIIAREGRARNFKQAPKKRLARILLDSVEKIVLS